MRPGQRTGTRGGRGIAVPRAALLACLAAPSLAACGAPGTRADRAAVSGPDAPRSAAAEAAQRYVIGPGDRLGIFVYDQPQLTLADVPVRPDGLVSTPLVSDVPAAGKTPTELSAELAKRLETYVREPNVTVIVHDFVGPFDRQIRVIGEAADPQAIAFREHMTVLDVMIMAKGLTRFAAGNSAVIARRADDPGAAPTRIAVRLSDLVKDGDISQNVEMRPGDTLIIPQSWF